MVSCQPTNVTDFAVVGGGPAGSLAAFLLAQQGAHVTLIDRGGVRPASVELLSGHARRLLEKTIHSPLAKTVGGIEVFETLSLWNTAVPIGTSTIFDPWGPGMAVDRLVLDRKLRDLASENGVIVLANTEVRAAQRLRDRWHLSLHQNRNTTTLQVRYLVLAAGHGAARILGYHSTGVTSQVALMSCVGSRHSKLDHALYVEAVADGWWYALPQPGGGWFIGFCTDVGFLKNRAERLSDFWNRKVQQTRLLSGLPTEAWMAAPIHGRPIAISGLPQAYGEGWIALGDAVFAPDPLSGKGLEFAIQSALLAAQFLLVQAGRPTQQEYAAWVREYARGHARARSIYFVSESGS